MPQAVIVEFLPAPSSRVQWPVIRVLCRLQPDHSGATDMAIAWWPLADTVIALVGEISNLLGVVSVCGSLSALFEHQHALKGLYSVGMVGGAGVGFIGVVQVLTVFCVPVRERDIDKMKGLPGGLLNMISGFCGAISNEQSLCGSSNVARWFGLVSAVSWILAEFVNMALNGKQAYRTLSKLCQKVSRWIKWFIGRESASEDSDEWKFYALVSEISSVLKILGIALYVIANLIPEDQKTTEDDKVRNDIFISSMCSMACGTIPVIFMHLGQLVKLLWGCCRQGPALRFLRNLSENITTMRTHLWLTLSSSPTVHSPSSSELCDPEVGTSGSSND
jgi:hypothetical protein